MSLKVFLIRCTHIPDSSSIIEDIQAMCLTGLASLAIFYFHFSDTTKQDARNLLSSVLFQLCSQSDKFSEVLSSVYSSHGNGSREPSIAMLLDCLKTILALQGQAPLYIVVDALDECPDSSGLPTQRQQVLKILKELFELKHPHVNFCVTSRPEIDIRESFEPLNPYNVSLHNQPGQIKDLADYVRSVVSSDAKMRNWRAEVKELVIDTLAKKGGGMYVIAVLMPCIPFSCDDFRFRWAHCQLETLRQCPLRYISSTLDELPETLDKTYDRILLSIPKKMQEDAHRIFQWIMVSSRPLRVEEVADVFAINFDEEICGIPKFEPSWQDENAETAVLSACSNLVTIVDARVDTGWRGKIVEFSHFSVQEYLTSDRVANSDHVSRFHLRLISAHTLLAKACLSALLHLDRSIDEAKISNFPLAVYAAKHWVHHAQFEDVSSYIRDGMDLLFEKDKPHFITWVWVYDIDCSGRSYLSLRGVRPETLDGVPLYYAALCGFGDLVERLLTAHPQDLDAKCGVYGAPLNAALDNGHLDIAQFLLDHGAVGDIMGSWKQSGLYIASSRGYANIVRSLIDRGADLNAECDDCVLPFGEVQWTPLHAAIHSDHPDIALLLLERGANQEIWSSWEQTALYMASSRGHADVVRWLIDRGADLNAECDDWDADFNEVWLTPLRAAIRGDHSDIALLLLERGADSETLRSVDQTALCMASSRGHADVMRSLIDRGADLNAKSRDRGEDGLEVEWTPLHAASYKGHRDTVILLLERGADPETRSSWEQTALHVASSRECADIVRQLISHGADPNSESEFGAPLYAASYYRRPEIARVLLEHGANPDALGHSHYSDGAALHIASYNVGITIIEILLKFGANVTLRNEAGWTPLHKAAYNLNLQVLVVLLNRGADPHALTNNGKTPIQLANTPASWASKESQAQIIKLLSERTGERIQGSGSWD